MLCAYAKWRDRHRAWGSPPCISRVERPNRSGHIICRGGPRLSQGDAILDLVVLLADSNMNAGVTAILNRPESLNCRKFAFKTYTHPWRDSGCLAASHDFLAPFTKQYQHALVLFDKEGCGDEDSATVIEQRVRDLLSKSGWNNRSEVVVLDPELEAWVWTQSPHLPVALGWAGDNRSLRAWLGARNLWPDEAPKPPRPKEALESVLRKTRKVRSSALYGQLGKNVSLSGCNDLSFSRFKMTLQRWFPIPQNPEAR